MKALIQPDGRVAQIVKNAEIFPVHKDLKWVTIPAKEVSKVQTEWMYEDSNFSAPLPVERSIRDIRKSSYPDIGDQLDAIWKQLNQDRLNGKEMIQEADNLLNAVLAVKAQYPLPEMPSNAIMADETANPKAK